MSNTPTTIGAAAVGSLAQLHELSKGGSSTKILYKADKGFYVRKGVRKLTGKFADLRDKDAADKKRCEAVAKFKALYPNDTIYKATKQIGSIDYAESDAQFAKLSETEALSRAVAEEIMKPRAEAIADKARALGPYLTKLGLEISELKNLNTEEQRAATWFRMLKAYAKAEVDRLPEEKRLERCRIAALAQNFEERVKEARGGKLTKSELDGIAAMEQAASDLPFYSQLTKDQQIKAWGVTSTETSKLSGDDLDRTSVEIWASTLSNDEKIQGVQEWLQIELDQMGGNNTNVGATFLRNMKYPSSKDQAERDKQIKIFKGSTIFNVAFQGSYLNVIESELKAVKASKGLTGDAFIESFNRIFHLAQVDNIDKNFCALFAAGMNKIDEQNGLSDTTKSDLKKKLGVQIALKLIAPKFSIPDNREAIKFGSLLQKFANLPNADEKYGIGDEQAKQLNDSYLAFVLAIVERGNANRTPVQSV